MQELELLVRAAIFKPANALVGILLQQAAQKTVVATGQRELTRDVSAAQIRKENSFKPVKLIVERRLELSQEFVENSEVHRVKIF